MSVSRKGTSSIGERFDEGGRKRLFMKKLKGKMNWLKVKMGKMLE